MNNNVYLAEISTWDMLGINAGKPELEIVYAISKSKALEKVNFFYSKKVDINEISKFVVHIKDPII